MLQLVQGLGFINTISEFILYCYVGASSTSMISMSTTTLSFHSSDFFVFHYII